MTPAISTALVSYLLPLAASAALGAGVWALTKLAAVLKTKAHGNKVFTVLGILTTHADAVVANMSATLLPIIREAAKDGVLSPSEVATLRTTALAKLKESLGTEGIAAVQEVLGVVAPSLDSFLSGFLETRVAALPKTQLPT